MSTEDAVPSKEWLDTSAALKLIPFGSEGDLAFQTALNTTFPADKRAKDRQAFLQWYIKLNNTVNEAVYRESIKKPLGSQAYVQALDLVDWTSMDSISHFYTTAYGSDSRLVTSPIYLGQDIRVFYYLQPELLTLDAKTDLKGDAASPHPYVVELRTINGEKSPFKYGFCLGSVRYGRALPTEQKALGLQRLPLQVFLDVQSSTKDLYAVFTTDFLDDNGDTMPLDSATNVWEHMPSAQNGRAIFGAIKVATVKELLRKEQGSPFFDPAAKSGFPFHLSSWQVDSNEVARVVRQETAAASSD